MISGPDSSPITEEAGEALALLESRWTLRVLTALVPGPARFTALEAAVPHLSRRMLSERLRHLEAHGLLRRHVDPGPPITSTYTLTASGERLRPGLTAMHEWAAARAANGGDYSPR